MHLFCPRRAFLLTSIVLVMADAATAQDWTMPWSDPRDRPARVDLNVSAGYLMPTDWSDLVVLGSATPATGVLEQLLLRDLRIEPGPVVGGAVTYWKAKYGARFSVARSESAIMSGGSNMVDVDSWFVDVRGAVGMLDYTPSRIAWPYFFFGLGGITYDLAQVIRPPLLTFIEHRPARPVDNLIVIERSGQQFLLEIDELGLETVLALNIGVGTDFRVPIGAGGIGVRLEVSDNVSPSPVGVRLHTLGDFGQPASFTRIGFGAVHHFRASAGLVVQIGR